MPIFPPAPPSTGVSAEYPDLSSARAAIEALMIDEVRVYVEHSGEGIDEQTGETLTTEETIYQGKGKVKRERTRAQEGREGGADTYVSRASIGIPVDSPAVPIGAYVEVLGAVRDPSLVGRKYLVVTVPGSTFAIQKTLECEEAKVMSKVRP